MAGYFSFQRMISTTIIKVVYFVGFVVLTTAGIGLIVWSGMQLHDANIGRLIGWRYVAIGAVTVVLGNLAWRVVCELWIVLFNIEAHLVAHGPANALRVSAIPANQFVERRAFSKDRKDKREVLPAVEVSRHEPLATNPSRSVLGLS